MNEQYPPVITMGTVPLPLKDTHIIYYASLAMIYILETIDDRIFCFPEYMLMRYKKKHITQIGHYCCHQKNIVTYS